MVLFDDLNIDCLQLEPEKSKKGQHLSLYTIFYQSRGCWFSMIRRDLNYFISRYYFKVKDKFPNRE